MQATQVKIQNTKQKSQFNGILIAGLILGIIFSSIIITILGIFALCVIGFGVEALFVRYEGITNRSVTVSVIVLFIFMIGPIVNLILTVRFLKGKSSNKTAVGILNLIFGGVISGILILIGTYQQDNSNSLVEQTVKNDSEY